MIAFADTINTSLPGYGQVTANGPVGIIVGAYYTALMVAGFLALGVLVYAGLMRIFQAGSHSGQSEAKKWFAAAGSGLVLLLGAYFLLTLINPGLTELRMPGLARLAVPVLPAPLTGYGCYAQDAAGFFTVPVCARTNDCSDLTDPQHSCSAGRCQIMNECKPASGGSCAAPASGPCSTAALQANGGGCFGSNIATAAGVCNVESVNGSLLRSGSDKCADGSPVSFGVFQINISANDLPGLPPCTSAFDHAFSGSNPTCHIIDRALYNRCVTAALTMNVNIAMACKISSGGSSWRRWGPRTRKICGL